MFIARVKEAAQRRLHIQHIEVVPGSRVPQLGIVDFVDR